MSDEKSLAADRAPGHLKDDFLPLGKDRNTHPKEYTWLDYILDLRVPICAIALAALSLLSIHWFGGIVDVPISLDSLLQSGSRWGGTTFEDRAIRLLEDHPLIDGHNDLAVKLRLLVQNHIYEPEFKEQFRNGSLDGQVDLKKIDDGRYAGAFWSAFWICPANISDFSDESYAPIVRVTLEQIDLLRRLSEEYPSYFPPTPSAASARQNFHKHHVHIAPLIIEGLHQIGNSFSTLRLYHSLGVRYATLNWNCHNIYSDAATLTYASNGTTIPAPPLWGGVSAQGRKVIYEMNRLGMIVDLAHVSANTMRDVLVGEHNPDFPVHDKQHTNDTKSSEHSMWTGSLAPPIFSHSSVHAICPHPRNVPDDVLPLVKQRNSIVMINFSPDFIACHYPPGADPATELPSTDMEDATLEQVARHIMYVGERIGYDHVGIGSDFDGIGSTPRGLEGVHRMPALVAELLRRGVAEMDVVKVVGGNVLRVWDEVDRISARLQEEGMLPAEDEVSKIISRSGH